MKYNEDEYLNTVLEYIRSTYKQHYVSGSDKDIQLIDLWAARGSAMETSINTAQKYLLRYGKKNGYSKTDLYKAIHYICFAAFFTPEMAEQPAPEPILLTEEQKLNRRS